MSDAVIDQKTIDDSLGDSLSEETLDPTQTAKKTKKKKQAPIKRLLRYVYKKRYTILAIAIILTAAIIMFGNNFKKIYDLRQQKVLLESGIEEEEKKAKELNIELKNVEQRSYIEKIARRNLGMIYPNEIIVTPVLEVDLPAQEPAKE